MLLKKMLDIVNGNDLVSVTGNVQGVQWSLWRTAKQGQITKNAFDCGFQPHPLIAEVAEVFRISVAEFSKTLASP
jgi:hypothetical protein